MRKNFTVIKADDSVQAVVREVSPEQAGVIPVIETDGSLVGIVEAHDLLQGFDRNPKVREIMRQDYVAARVGETVDEVTRDMVIHDVENIVVVEGDGLLKPIGVARAADILRLRRWVIKKKVSGISPCDPRLPRTASPTPIQHRPKGRSGSSPRISTKGGVDPDSVGSAINRRKRRILAIVRSYTAVSRRLHNSAVCASPRGSTGL